MTANPINIVERRHAVQYDGTNSGDIETLFDANTLSEVGGVWTFESPTGSTVFVVNTDDYILFAQNMALGKFSPTDFANFYRCNAQCDDTEALQEAVGTVEAALETVETSLAAVQTSLGGGFIRAVGVAPVPTLLLNTETTVAVQIQPAMPDSSYTAYASKFAGISIVDLSILSVAVVDTDTVNVTVRNVGLVTLTGASVLVHAVD